MERTERQGRVLKVLRHHDATWLLGDVDGTFIRLWGGVWDDADVVVWAGGMVEGRRGAVPFSGGIFGRSDTH
jgi:hypothetical protein